MNKFQFHKNIKMKWQQIFNDLKLINDSWYALRIRIMIEQSNQWTKFLLLILWKLWFTNWTLSSSLSKLISQCQFVLWFHRIIESSKSIEITFRKFKSDLHIIKIRNDHIRNYRNFWSSFSDSWLHDFTRVIKI